MIDASAIRSTHQADNSSRIKFDPLTAKRMEEGRQKALAVTQAQHQEKVRMAVERYMKWPSEAQQNATVSLSQAQQAYGNV